MSLPLFITFGCYFVIEILVVQLNPLRASLVKNLRVKNKVKPLSNEVILNKKERQRKAGREMANILFLNFNPHIIIIIIKTESQN